MARALTAAVVALALVATSCGDSSPKSPGLGVDGKPLGLAVGPRDSQLAIETDKGVWLVPRGDPERGARRLAAELVEATGNVPIGRLLTVAYTRGVMLGSSHPDLPRSGVASNLGLLLSQDGGRTWRVNSLYSKADLHLMQPTAKGLWALDVARSCIAITRNFGSTWQCRRLPGAVAALAVDPRDPEHAVVVTEHGLLETRDEGRSWRPAAFGEADAVVWLPSGTLVGVTRAGQVRQARAGKTGTTIGRLDGRTVALAASSASIWALSRDGAVSRSRDGGRSWSAVARLR